MSHPWTRSRRRRGRRQRHSRPITEVDAALQSQTKDKKEEIKYTRCNEPLCDANWALVIKDASILRNRDSLLGLAFMAEASCAGKTGL